MALAPVKIPEQLLKKYPELSVADWRWIIRCYFTCLNHSTKGNTLDYDMPHFGKFKKHGNRLSGYQKKNIKNCYDKKYLKREKRTDCLKKEFLLF